MSWIVIEGEAAAPVPTTPRLFCEIQMSRSLSQISDDRNERAQALKTIYDGLRMVLDGAYQYQLACIRDDQAGETGAVERETPAQVHQQKLWTVAEIAEYLRVEPRTVYVWVREKGMPARKAGDELRFNPDEVDRWTMRDGETKETIEKARIRVVR